jgi:hypothetical protein
MNVLLALARACPPGLLARLKLNELGALTADAFGCEPPLLPDLASYALFTRAEVDRAIAAGSSLSEIRERLRVNARAFGEKLRASLGIRSRREGREGLALLYRALRIELRAEENGEVVIPRCFFSAHYTPQVCRVVSGLDEGLAMGFCGGRLEFGQRITEGRDCCRAALSFGGPES